MPKKIFKKRRFLKSFTLIELIVIATIILIFVLLVYSQIEQRSTARTRDVKRVSEVNTIRTALQLYYMDKGKYPTSTESEIWCSLEQTDPSASNYCDNLRDALTLYLSQFPEDPIFGKGREPDSNTFYSYQYISTSSGEGYKLHTDLETREPYEIGSFMGAKIAYVPPTPPPPPPPPPSALTCTLRATCNPGETSLLYLYEETDSHVDDDTGDYKICCQNISSVNYRNRNTDPCHADETAVISMFNISLPGGSHAASSSGPNTYDYLVCVKPTSGNLQCEIQAANSCSAGFGKVVGMFAGTDSHVQGPDYTGEKYDFSVCCKIQ